MSRGRAELCHMGQLLSHCTPGSSAPSQECSRQTPWGLRCPRARSTPHISCPPSPDPASSQPFALSCPSSWRPGHLGQRILTDVVSLSPVPVMILSATSNRKPDHSSSCTQGNCLLPHSQKVGAEGWGASVQGLVLSEAELPHSLGLALPSQMITAISKVASMETNWYQNIFIRRAKELPNRFPSSLIGRQTETGREAE